MKAHIIEENDRSLSFLLADATAVEANAIRRACMSSVDVFAVDKVTFYENSSSMFDEYIAHRIGLVPLATPAKGYSETDEILFTLEAEGPKVVYSGDMESSDKEVKVANNNIPIIKLAEHQRIRLEGKAILRTAAKHSKFQPGLVTYEQKDNQFNFYVETFGQMPPRQIINNGLESIKKNVKALEKQVKQL